MSIVTDLLASAVGGPYAAPGPRAAVDARLATLLERAEPLGNGWAERYPAAWALQENIAEDAREWSKAAAHDVVRHLRAPYPSLAMTAALVFAAGVSNLVTVGLLAPAVGVVSAVLGGMAGVLATVLGLRLGARYAGIVRQHRAGIPPLREELRQRIELHALASLSRRRERLAGPRRPIPRHAFDDLLPQHAHHIAAGWMRHLGELDATVLKPDEIFERAPALEPEQAHVLSSGYIGRVWSFTAETPEVEVALIIEAASAMDRKPMLFTLSSFSEQIVAHANRRGVALLAYRPWHGKIVGCNLAGQRCLARGLRDADGLRT